MTDASGPLASANLALRFLVETAALVAGDFAVVAAVNTPLLHDWGQA